MSGIAEVLLTLGYRITGSDIKESARTRNLERRGATIWYEHRGENVHGSDVVVYSSAVDENNPELQEAHDQSIPVIPRAEMLAELMKLKDGIAVAGTHGKTTTTAMVSVIMQSAGYDPTTVVGGRMHNMGIGARLGTDDMIVVEADESDGSFLKLDPVMSVVTNIEDDHMDFYESMEQMEQAYIDFINSVPFYGFTAICGDDPRLSDLTDEIHKPFQTYGFEDGNQLQATGLRKTDFGSQFTVKIDDRPLGEVQLPVPGEYNVLNALGAMAIGFEQGIAFDLVKEGLENFEGVHRRFEHKGEINGFAVYDDYAHHPTEVENTLETANEYFDGELLVIFQPHRYTRTRDLASDFGKALTIADRLCVMDVYAAGEEPIPGIDLEFLSSTIGPHRNGHITEFEGDRDRVLEWVEEQIDPDQEQVLLTVG
ncbi:MAG: UDP-N-acetylmuramate--L-alanine ligase, partial [bacterium]